MLAGPVTNAETIKTYQNKGIAKIKAAAAVLSACYCKQLLHSPPRQAQVIGHKQ